MADAVEQIEDGQTSFWWVISFCPATILIDGLLLARPAWTVAVSGAIEWLALRLLLSRPWRGFDPRNSGLYSWTVFLLRELAPLGWFILALLGSSLKDLDSAVFNGGPWRLSPAGMLIGLLAPLLAWLEPVFGESRSRVRALLCAIAIAAHVEAVWKLLTGLFNWMIAWLMDGAALHLGTLFFWVCLSGFAAVFFLLSRSNWVWELSWPNRLTHRLIGSYLRADAAGKLHRWLRHAGHLLTRALLRALWRALRGLWHFVLGRFPAFLEPIELHTSRFEHFLWEKIKSDEEEIAGRFGAWRIGRINESEDNRQTSQALPEAISRQVRSLLALGDYLVCPHCGDSDLSEQYTLDKVWRMSLAADRLLSTAHALVDARLSAGNAPAASEASLDSDTFDLLIELNERLRRNYNLLLLRTADDPTKAMLSSRLSVRTLRGEDFERVQWKIKRFITLELAEVTQQAKRKKDHDLDRLGWRDQLLLCVKLKSELQVYWTSDECKQFWVNALMAEFGRVEDWGGMIELGRLLSIKTSYRMMPRDELDLGEAFWRQAHQLGAGPLGQWAWDQAVKHLFKAGARDQFPAPFDDAPATQTVSRKGSHDKQRTLDPARQAAD